MDKDNYDDDFDFILNDDRQRPGQQQEDATGTRVTMTPVLTQAQLMAALQGAMSSALAQTLAGASGSKPAESGSRKPWAAAAPQVPHQQRGGEADVEFVGATRRKRGRPTKAEAAAAAATQKEGEKTNSSRKAYPDEIDSDAEPVPLHGKPCYRCKDMEGKYMVLPCGHFPFCSDCLRHARVTAICDKVSMRCPVSVCRQVVLENTRFFDASP